MKKIIVHDYGNYPFILTLSQKLNGSFKIKHLTTSSPNNPNSKTVVTSTDNFTFKSISHKKISKSNFIQRFYHEYIYGKKLVSECKKDLPDIIISANTPIPSQFLLWNFTRKYDIKFIFWLQDIISVAAETVLKKKLGIIGILIAKILQIFEKKILRGSEHIVTITEDFNSFLENWGVSQSNISFIPNWAPIEELPLQAKNNVFSENHGLVDSFNIIYSGTMGYKHNPQIIIDLADELLGLKDLKIIVISEGVGMNYLQKVVSIKKRSNLVLLPFQKYELLPKVLASADVLLTILEPEAGLFSVPSKVWSSFCAGRASLLFVPEDNLAAKITKQINAGINADSSINLVEGAIKLYENRELCIHMGRNARQYAEENFQINQIFKNFFHIINSGLENDSK